MKISSRMLTIVFVFVLLSALSACSKTSKIEVEETLDGAGPLGAATLPIYNGSPPNAPEHEAVVALHMLARGGKAVYTTPFCSGTLIAGDVVLTAAHCLDSSKEFKPGFDTLDPGKLAIYVGDDPSIDLVDHLYAVSETLIHPGYDKFALRNDLGLVRLAGLLPEPVAPVDPLPASVGFTSADVGGLLNFAGFGQTEYGTTGDKLQADGTLGSLGCYVAGCPTTGDVATQIAYTQGTGGPCFGDSGGPAFVYRDGVPYVGGITSYGDGDCLVYGVSTRVDAYETLINDFIANAGGPDCSADGVCNTECAAGEDPDCSTPPSGDCGNGTCDDGESCDGRDSTVDCPSDCAGKTTGKPSGRFCYVGGVCEGPGC